MPPLRGVLDRPSQGECVALGEQGVPGEQMQGEGVGSQVVADPRRDIGPEPRDVERADCQPIYQLIEQRHAAQSEAGHEGYFSLSREGVDPDGQVVSLAEHLAQT